MKLHNDILINMGFKRKTVQHHEHVICKYDNEMYNIIAKTRWNIFKDAPISTAGEYCGCLSRLVNSDLDRQIKLLEIKEEHLRLLYFIIMN